MKRLLIGLVVLGLLAAFAGPAGAVKPDKPGKPPPDPQVGVTCEEAHPNYPKMQKGTHDFESDGSLVIVLTRAQPMACYDVTTTDTSDWTVEFDEDSAEPREMTVMVRDSVPGDFCGTEGYQTRSGQAVFDDPNPWIFPGIPSSEVDACGAIHVDDQDESLAFLADARHLPRDRELTITVTVP
jgi:hypothetical protein